MLIYGGADGTRTRKPSAWKATILPIELRLHGKRKVTYPLNIYPNLK